MTRRCLKWNFIELDMRSFASEENQDYAKTTSCISQDDRSNEPDPKKDTSVIFYSKINNEQNSI